MDHSTRSSRYFLLLGLAFFWLGWAPAEPVAAQEGETSTEEASQDQEKVSEDGPGVADEIFLEEVVVTARKREEALSEVPIAITLFDGERIQDGNLTNITELADAAPSFHHSEDVNSFDRYIVRGLGTTGSILGFEEAVGQVINGYFFGRSRFGRTMFLDIERVEVLKGPQGALIGKNNSVGAINITTRKPGLDFGGYLSTTMNFEDGEGYAVETAVDVPISENVRTRFAARFEDRDGWLKNFGTGQDDQLREDFTVRGILDWNVSDTLLAEVMVQVGRLRGEGRNREIYNCVGDAASANPRDPAEDCVFNGEKDVLFLVNGEPNPEAHDTDYSMFGLTLNKFFKTFNITYLGNFSEYESSDDWDSDHTDIEWTGIFVRDDWDQLSHEIRVASNGGGKVDYIAGLYYSDQENDYIQSFMFCRGPFGLCTGGNTNPGFLGLQRHGWSTLVTESLAFFGQIDWHLNDELTLTVGGRYTDEDRDIQTNATVLTPYSLEVNASTLVDCPNVSDELDGVGIPIGFDCGPARFTNSGFFDRSESDFTPNATLRWQPSENAMYYLTYGEGFKSGGFQFPTYVPQAALTRQLVEYQDETTTHYELGGKNTLAGGRLQFNWAFWSTDFEDVQVSSLDPVTIIQNVNNAAQANSTGFEGDLLWSINRQTTLSAAFALTDAEYDEFRTAPCYAGQTAALGCRPFTFPDGTVANVQDLAGTPLAYAPDAQFNIRLSGRDLGITPKYKMGYEIFYYWKDDFHFVLANDPLDSQSAFGKVDASLSFGPKAAPWTLALIGKNLTDKLTANAGDSTFAIGQSGDIGPTPNFKFVEPGRQIGLQLRYRF